MINPMKNLMKTLSQKVNLWMCNKQRIKSLKRKEELRELILDKKQEIDKALLKIDFYNERLERIRVVNTPTAEPYAAGVSRK